MSVHDEMDEYARWQARFATPDYAFGKEPNDFLKSCQGLLPRHGRALAVADGEGRNGVWLAEHGLDVVSLDFSPAAQSKARALAAERAVEVSFVQADVHAFDYPHAAFDLVVEIFTQFSPPAERAIKWRGMRRTLKSGGLLIIQGYTPKQLQYGTGGPKQVEKLYTRAMLEREFGDFHDVKIIEE
jgi:SAM-dependent methyltransferase